MVWFYLVGLGFDGFHRHVIERWPTLAGLSRGVLVALSPNFESGLAT